MLGFVSSGWNTWKPHIVQDIMQNHTAGLQKGENGWAKRKHSHAFLSKNSTSVKGAVSIIYFK